MTTIFEPPAALDLASIKARQKTTWESGDFGRVARFSEPGAAEFMTRRQIHPGMRVLDVACGTGNLALLAAQRGAAVCGVDIAENLIAQAQARAAAARLNIAYCVGDAEALPYADASFDLVVSMFGVMFAPRPEVAAAELLRVTRPGGTIALANWTTAGFIGRMFDVFRAFVPPAPGVPSPLLWGDELEVRERLQPGSAIRARRRLVRLEYPFDPAGTVEFFRRYYGPTHRGFAALDVFRQVKLHEALERLQTEFNVSTDPEVTVVEAEYLEVLAVRRG